MASLNCYKYSNYYFNKGNAFLTNYPKYNQKKTYLTILTEMSANGIQESTATFP